MFELARLDMDASALTPCTWARGGRGNLNGTFLARSIVLNPGKGAFMPIRTRLSVLFERVARTCKSDRWRILSLMGVVLGSSLVASWTLAQHSDVAGQLGVMDGTQVSLSTAPARVEYVDPAEFREKWQSVLPESTSSNAPIEKVDHYQVLTNEALEKARSMSPDEEIEVRLFLAPQEFDFSRFRREDPEETLRDLKSQLTPGWESVASRSATLGAEVKNKYWLDNSVVIVVRAGKLADLLEETKARAVYIDDLQEEYTSADGIDLNDMTLGTTLFMQGIKGETGGRSSLNGNNVKLGFIDSPLNTTHVGFLDGAGGPSRIVSNLDCTSGSCVPGPSSSAASHGTTVVSIAAGSIQQGQHPFVTDPIEQRRRSWTTSETDIYYYRAGNSGPKLAAMQDAIIQGVDVMNWSGVFLSSCNTCTPTADCGGLNDAIRDLMEAGVLFVQSAGNDDITGSPCNVNWAGFRPAVISVTGAETIDGADPYDDLPAPTYLSSGNVAITTVSGFNTQTNAVDLMAPGALDFTYTNNSNFDAIPSASAATSWAAPVVTGLAGLLREAFATKGYDMTDAYMLKANVLLMGDYDKRTQPYDDLYYNPPSSTMGHGRVRAHWPYSPLLVAPWGWGWRSFRIYQGEERSWPVWSTGPESSAITKWKWVVFTKEHDLTATSFIIARVYDTCAGAGYVKGDYTATINKRITLDGADIGGRCLEMRVYGYQVPPEGVELYSADYFQSGDPTLH